jgi:hypothetical protein
MQQVRANTIVGQTIVTMLQWAQTTAGIPEQILVNTSARLPQMENEKYVTSL